MVPGIPRDLTVKAITSDSVTLEAQLSAIGTSPLFLVTFAVRDLENVLVLHNITEDIVAGEVVTAYIIGLAPKTLYSVAVYTANGAGMGNSSGTLEFMTC